MIKDGTKEMIKDGTKEMIKDGIKGHAQANETVTHTQRYTCLE